MDVEQIDNILGGGKAEEVQYSDAQWLYLLDNNNQQYTSQINWVTTPLKTQFIDFYNSYLWIPTRIEVANAAAPPTVISNPGYNGGSSSGVWLSTPPLICARESSLSLISNVTITTDQGQTWTTDVNTQFINNLRLKIERTKDWMWTTGTELDYGYDEFTNLPSSTPLATTGPLGPATTTGGYQSGANYQAPLGLEPGNIYNAPLTNDANEFGNNQLGTFVATSTSGGVLMGGSINGVSISGGSSAVNYTVPITMPDGRIALFPVILGGSQSSLSIGGIQIYINSSLTSGNYVGLPNGTYTFQAKGTSNVLNQGNAPEDVYIPIQITIYGRTHRSIY